MGATFSTFVQKMNLTSLSEAWKKDSLELLLMYLSDPQEPAWQKYAWVLGCMHLDHQRFSLPEKRISWQERLNAVIPAHFAERFGDLEGTDLIGSFETPENTGYGIHISVKSGKEALSIKETEEMRFLLWFCDEAEKREHSTFDAVL